MEKNSSNQQVDPQHMTRGLEVFVGGLPRGLTESKITELFADCGEISEIRLKKDPSGISKGYCFVRFTTREAAKRAIKEKSGIMLEGKKIGVLPSTEQTSLFLGNVRKDWNADQFDGMIRQAFEDVVSARLALPSKSASNTTEKHQNRGFGFVRFSSHGAAARAYRVASKSDFLLGGNWHPTIEWAQEETEFDPEELAKVRIAFVRNLPNDADENYLEKLFAPFGKIDKVVISRKNSSTVGFIHYDKRPDLEKAINTINGKMVEGPKGGATFEIQVEVARPMEKSRKRGHDTSQSRSSSKTMSHANQSIGHYAFSDVHRSKILKPKHLREEAGISDPYEATVLSLPGPVKERLLQILRLGVATRYDIDMQCLSRLRGLPDSLAIYVLDKFMIDGGDYVNKGAYLVKLITELHQVEKLGPTRHALHLSSAAEISRESMLHDIRKFGSRQNPLHDPMTSRQNPLHDPMTSRQNPLHDPITSRQNPLHDIIPSRQNPLHDPIISRQNPLYDPITSRKNPRHDPITSSMPLNLSDRVHLPVVDNLPSDIMTSTRYNHYTKSPASPHYSLSARDHTLSHQTGYGRRVETSPLPSRSMITSDFLSHQTGYRTVEVQGSSRLQPPLGPQPQPLSSAYGSVELGPSIDSTVDLQPRPQVRFDPYTGVPYKFDPFTGEPIKPDSLPRGGSSF